MISGSRDFEELYVVAGLPLLLFLRRLWLLGWEGDVGSRWSSVEKEMGRVLERPRHTSEEGTHEAALSFQPVALPSFSILTD